jgi:integrase
MASLHRQAKSPFWFCAFTDADGTRRFRSTKCRNRKQAEEICNGWAKAVTLAKSESLTSDTAHEVVARTVADIYLHANQEKLPRNTIREWCSQWIESKKIETAPTTVARYEGILQRFHRHLDKRADKSIATLTPADVLRFRDRLARELSTSSANLSVKTLRICFGAANKQGLIPSNPAAMVDKIRSHAESKRRPFTPDEIRRLLDTAGDSEWRGIILTACYTAARLGDVARLQWRNVDLQTRVVAFTASKTGKPQVLPIAPPLANYFESLPSSDNPTASVFPQAAAAAKRIGTLSNSFHELMVSAGLAEKRSKIRPVDKDGKKIVGKGRNASRPVGELSFHCLRHSAVTFLKAAGVSDSVAQAIAGHSSSAVSKIYTHLDTATLRDAVAKIEDVTAPAKGAK